MRRILPVFMMSFMMMFFSVLGFAQSQPPKKVYIVYLNDTQGSQFFLQDVQAADFNGLKSIQGTSVGGGWANNRTVYIPVERVAEIIEEDSLDQYKADVASVKK